MAHPAKTDGLRLLRCINDTQSQGQEGSRVDPPRAAQEIGLDVGSERYHDALRYLVDEAALLGDEHTATETGTQPPGYAGHAVYFFTRRAMKLLEERDEDWTTTLDPDNPSSLLTYARPRKRRKAHGETHSGRISLTLTLRGGVCAQV